MSTSSLPSPSDFNNKSEKRIIKALEEHENKTQIIEETEKNNQSDDSEPKEVRISFTLNECEHTQLIKTLVEYIDVFAWSHGPTRTCRALIEKLPSIQFP